MAPSYLILPCSTLKGDVMFSPATIVSYFLNANFQEHLLFVCSLKLPYICCLTKSPLSHFTFFIDLIYYDCYQTLGVMHYTVPDIVKSYVSNRFKNGACQPNKTNCFLIT